MAAPVRVEAAAQSDPRFGVFGRLLGTTRFDALGRMVSVWSWCTERQRLDVPLFFFAGLFDDLDPDRVATSMVAAELGEWVDCMEPSSHPPGCRHVRARGTEGRIEWLGDFRQSRVDGGKKRAASAKRDSKGRLVSSSSSSSPPAAAGPAGPAALQLVTSSQPASPPAGGPAQSSALSPSLSPSLKDLPSPGATDPAPTGSAPAPSRAPSKGEGAGRGARGSRPAGTQPPLPFSIERMGEAFARGAGRAFALDSFDRGLAKPLSGVIRQLGEQGRTLGDIESAGRLVAGWKLSEPLAWAWLAKAGNLTGAIAKAGARSSDTAAKDELPPGVERWA